MKRLALRLVLAGVMLAGGVAGVLHLRSGGTGGEPANLAQAAEPDGPERSPTGKQRPTPIADPQNQADSNPDEANSNPDAAGDGFHRVETPQSRPVEDPAPEQPEVVRPAAGGRYATSDDEPSQPAVAVGYDEVTPPSQPASRYDGAGQPETTSADTNDQVVANQGLGEPEYDAPTYGAAPQQPAPSDLETTGAEVAQADADQPGAGQPTYGQPQYGQPQYGQPQYGQTQDSQPQYGQAQYGQPVTGGNEPEQPVAPGSRYAVGGSDPQAVAASAASEQGETPGRPQPLRFTDENVTPVTGPPVAREPSVTQASEPEVLFVADVPGERRLEGTQAPTLTIEKKLPPEIQVGKPALLHIHVRNTGSTPAHEVTVVDRVPQGTRLIDLAPQAAQTADGALLWSLGTLDPGEEKTIKVELMPEAEGEIGSVAQVVFHAQASARTVCTRPELVVEQTAPPKVLIGQNATITILITNRGTGAAANVILEEDVPPQFSHPAGNELENEIGVIRPGETRRLNLTLTAVEAGQVRNTIHIRGEGSVAADSSIDIEVIAPQLQLGLQGPKRRYLQRQVTFDISAANPGTALAKDLRMVAYLPKGLTFVSSNKGGQYDSQRHAVLWSMQELPPGQADTVQLTATPVETGEQKIRLEGTGDLGLAQSFEHAMLVESVAELHFTVADKADPIEIASETIYEVTVVNDGTKPDTNVQVAAALPAGLKPVEGEGPTRATVEGQNIFFEPLPRLAPQDKVVYRIRAQGVQDGDQRVRVQIASDEAPTPVTKEEVTRVYSDR